MLDPLAVSIPIAQPVSPLNDAPIRKLLKPSPTHPDDYILELDYSTLSNFLECPRKFENYAIRSREADRDGSAVSFGGLFHKLEESRLRGFPFSVQQEMIESHFIHFPPPVNDHRTGDRMLSVWKTYRSRYDTDGWIEKIYTDSDGPFVERPFRVELCTILVNAVLPYDEPILTSHSFESRNLRIRNLHIFYIGRIDVILTDGDLLWIVDHKTSSRGGREFEEAFRLSLQTRGYATSGQKITGRTVSGLIMNAVVIRPLTKTGTGTEFNRTTYFYQPDSLAEWEECTKAHISDIVASLLRGFFPQTARSFKSPCSGCDYSENCSLPKNQRGADLASELYRDVKWSPMKE